MSGKVANLIAVELAILIAITGWLAFARLTNNAPSVAEAPRPAANLLASAEPIYAPERRHSYLAKETPEIELADLRTAEPAPAEMLAEPEVSDTTYLSENDQQPAVLEDNSPYYDEVIPEPVITSPGYLVAPYPQVITYAPIQQIIVVTSIRNSGNRRRMMPPRSCDPRAPMAQPRPSNQPPPRVIRNPATPPGNPIARPITRVAPRATAQSRPNRTTPLLRAP